MSRVHAFFAQLRLRPKLIAAMLAAGLIPLMLASGISSYQTGQALEEETMRKLDSLVSVKRHAIEDYFKQIEHQAATLASDPGVKSALMEFKAAFGNLAAESASEVSTEQVASALTKQYTRVFGDEYHKQSGQSIDATQFIPEDQNARLAQYFYIASNGHPLGQKDKLQALDNAAVYHRVHAEFHPAFNDYQARFGYYDLFLIDTAGNVVYSVFKEVDFASNLATGAGRESGLGQVYAAALKIAQGETSIVDFAAYAPSYEAPAAFIASPVFSNGKLIGVVALQMPVGKINDVMQQSAGLGETGETYLVGSDGLMRSQSRIDQTPTLLKAKIDSIATAKAFAGESGYAKYQDRHGGMVFGAYAPLTISGLKWAIIAEIDQAEAAAAAVSLRWVLAGIAVLAGVIVACFAYFFGARISRRVAASAAIANRVAQGDFDNQITVDSPDEIGDLMRALETMQTELFGRILREKNEAVRIGQALEVATANVMIADNNRNVVFMNTAVKQMLEAVKDALRTDLPNFDPARVLGQSIDQFHKNPVHQAQVLADLKATFSTEIKIGGRVMQVIANPVINPQGERLGTVVEWADLTAQRNAEHQIQNAIAQAAAGNLGTRLDAAAFDGFLKTIAEGVNTMLDALVGPLSIAAEQLKLIADGKIPQPIEADFKGDFSAIKDNLNTCAKVLKVLLDDATRLADAAVAGQLDERADLNQHWGDFRRIVAGMNNTLDAIATPVSEIKEAMTGLAAGDLQREIASESRGEFAVLRDAVNSCVVTLREMVQKIRAAALSIGTSAEEIAKGNQDLSSRTEEQASSLQTTASAMEELTGTVKQNADNAKQANQLAVGAREEAQQGGEVVAQAVQAMGQINESSKRIADIIGVIDEIAFQTNLLALNAAVEAARAGEHGRGFAVVASEVRNLAQRSAVAAKEIKVLIKDSVSKVEDGARLVDASGATLTGIVSAVKKVSDIVGEIAAASAEQSVGIEQVNKSIMQMEQVTQQNAALVEESAAASESMDDEAQGLGKLIDFFKVDDRAADFASKRSAKPAQERRSANRPWSKPASASASGPASRISTQRAVGSDAGDDWDEF